MSRPQRGGDAEEAAAVLRKGQPEILNHSGKIIIINVEVEDTGRILQRAKKEAQFVAEKVESNERLD